MSRDKYVAVSDSRCKYVNFYCTLRLYSDFEGILDTVDLFQPLNTTYSCLNMKGCMKRL